MLLVDIITYCPVQISRSVGEDETEEVSLPVALHSPLHVLKEQLEELSGITQPSQVLILCDLDDPDRNRDVLLTGREYESLFDIGIRNGSYLTLHRVGANRRQEDVDAELLPADEAVAPGEETFTVSSGITAAMADHSYNGILFDIEAKSPFEVDITSIHVGGMLGRVVSRLLLFWHMSLNVVLSTASVRKNRATRDRRIG
jgi:hypothetical protein